MTLPSSRRLGAAARHALLSALALAFTLSSNGRLALAGDTPKPAPSASAQPEKQFAVEVMVLHATNGDKGIDPRIGEMPELKQPPFSSYRSYELLQKVKLPLKKDDPRTTELPNGRVLQTKLLDVLADETVKVSASINQPGGKTFLPLLEVKAKLGQPFIVAGQSFKAGILVLVIRVSK